MKKIVLIAPYFGRFPNYFPLFLESCRYNPTIDWLIFTDISVDIDYPTNVHFITMTFDQLCKKIQSKFDFKITLDTPYKLCDYKPAYGYIFQEFLENIDFWGHCDFDLLFGDLRKFFTEEKLDYYNKIGHLGHLTLYRNTTDINKLFMKEICGRIRYQEVFTTNRSCVFDEWDDLSINHLFLKSGERICFWNNFCDVYPFSDNLTRVVRKVDVEKKWLWREKHLKSPLWITWENGKVFIYHCFMFRKRQEEVAYAHFQKRNMEVRCDLKEAKILCLHDGFERYTGKIPLKRKIECFFHRFIDRKFYKHGCEKLCYMIAEITTPFRHCLKK